MAFGYGIWAIVGLICAIWVIFDVWSNRRCSTGEKVVWTIFAVLFSIITAIVYLIVRKR